MALVICVHVRLTERFQLTVEVIRSAFVLLPHANGQKHSRHFVKQRDVKSLNGLMDCLLSNYKQ